MSNVLVTSSGSVATDITIKSLKRMGHRVIGCNIYPREWIVESCEMDSFFQIPPVNQSKEYLEAVKKICTREHIDYLFPMIDYEIDLLTKNRTWFQDHNVVLCISPDQSLEYTRNKTKLQNFVSENCSFIKSIPTKMLNDINELEWDFPVVCKPYNGRSSQGLKYIYNKEEWEEFRKTVDKDVYIVEPYIDGPLVMVEIVRQSNPHKVVAMTRREIMSTPHGCSTTVLVFQDLQLEQASKELADKLDVLGDINFEYILANDGTYYLVECNPRFSAGCEFACIGGYDCIENHLKCFMGKEIEDYHFKHNMIIARKYEEYITAVDVDVPYCNTIH